MMQVSKGHGRVSAMAEAHFLRIRQTVALQAAPATLKAAFLEPVATGQQATDMSVHIFARTDANFMSWFTCGHHPPSPWLHPVQSQPRTTAADCKIAAEHHHCLV